MKKKIKLFLLNIIATTDYDKMGKTTRIFKLVFDILSALLYTSYAVYVLVVKNNSAWTMYLLIGIAVIFISLIGIFIARSKTNQKYSKKNYKLTTKTLRNLIKLLSLIPPVFVIIQGKIVGNGWESALNIYAIIHLSYLLYKLFLSIVKLYIHKYKKDKYIKKEQKSQKRTAIKKVLYKAIQGVAKSKLDKENYVVKDNGNYQIPPSEYYEDKGKTPEIEIIEPPMDNLN